MVSWLVKWTTLRQNEVWVQPDVILCGWLGSEHQLTNCCTQNQLRKLYQYTTLFEDVRHSFKYQNKIQQKSEYFFFSKRIQLRQNFIKSIGNMTSSSTFSNKLIKLYLKIWSHFMTRITSRLKMTLKQWGWTNQGREQSFCLTFSKRKRTQKLYSPTDANDVKVTKYRSAFDKCCLRQVNVKDVVYSSVV